MLLNPQYWPWQGCDLMRAAPRCSRTHPIIHPQNHDIAFHYNTFSSQSAFQLVCCSFCYVLFVISALAMLHQDVVVVSAYLEACALHVGAPCIC